MLPLPPPGRHNYREIVLANECRYLEWFSEAPQHAFFRREDFPWRTRWVLAGVVVARRAAAGAAPTLGISLQA